MAGDLASFRPPVLVGERVIWLGSGSGEPQSCTVRWIGRVPEITAGWTIGIELDSPLPVGGIDGTWRKRSLFACKPKHGLLVPIDKIMKVSQSVPRKHSVGEKYYENDSQHISQLLSRKSSYPEATTRQEFLSRLLPPPCERKEKPEKDSSEALRFKTAVTSVQNKPGPVAPHQLTSTPKIAPLTVENVKSLSRSIETECETSPSSSIAQSIRQQTLKELAQFKKHLDELEKLKNSDYGSRSKRNKISTNPESLYSLAETTPVTEKDLFLRLIGNGVEPPKRIKPRNSGKEVRHKVPSVDEEPRKIETDENKAATSGDDRLSEEKRIKPRISGKEARHRVPSVDEEPCRIETDEKKSATSGDHRLSEAVVETRQKRKCDEKATKENVSKPILNETNQKKPLLVRDGTVSIIADIPLHTTGLLDEDLERQEFNLFEKEEDWTCNESAITTTVSVYTAPEEEEDSQSVGAAGPTPTTRKKRQPQPPVPVPRRRSSDVFTTMPPNPSASANSMVGISGTFRRIEEDDIDRGGTHLNGSAHPSRRILSASVSAPDGSKKGIFSFLKWFRKNKPPHLLDLESFNAPSIASSPLFPRRLANAESVDTLYSIATVSSFAFVPGSQYQGLQCPERRKKRRAPPPPPQHRDISLPNTLESRAKQHHRRSVSESYKDRRSGAFAHVHGKRKAPAPPNLPTRDRLYPTLSSVKNGTLLRRKKPAPMPPMLAQQVEIENVAAENGEVNTSTDLKDDAPVSAAVPSPPSVPVPLPVPVDVVTPSGEENVVCNDTLKLERGVLKPNRVLSPSPVPPDVAKSVPVSPVSPRPWYKRKSLEKRREKISDDWMPEVGIARSITPSENSSPLKFPFHSIFKGEDKKKEEKRKSGLSLLANISELDREAAEICRREQVEREQQLADVDAKFYGGATAETQEVVETEAPTRNSTRELISLFNAISNVTRVTVNDTPLFSESAKAKPDLEKGVCATASNRFEIKTATVVDTKDVLNKESASPYESPSSPVHFNERDRNSTFSTIAEISEPSSSAATLNQYAEPIWTCTRCTLENQQWKSRCDACSACKPNYKPTSMSARRNSEMEFDIDWEEELKKHFPNQKSPSKEKEVLSKLTLGKEGDILIQTETKLGAEQKMNPELKDADVNEVRKKRLDFFKKSLGAENVMTVRDAAAKKSLDETEKLKLKGMLKEMKDSLPKYEGVKNKEAGRNSNGTGPGRGPLPLPDVTGTNDNTASKASDDIKYGAIKKVRPAEALLVTTTTVFEDIKVRKNVVKDPVVPVAVQHFSTVGMRNGEPYTSMKKARRVGDGPFELMRARDLANIIESKTGTSYPAHVYANYPPLKVSDESSWSDVSEASKGREVARLASQLTRASGVEKFKAGLDPACADTLAVNRLLRRLESAIAAGKHDQAATLARDLAGLKVNCSVVRQRPSPSPSPTFITVDMYVEDKMTHQGPIPLRVQPSMTLSDLKMKVQADFQIPCHVQRWILGKQLATDEFRTLEELGVTMDQCPIFLYLVAPEPDADIIESKEKEKNEETNNNSREDSEDMKNRLGKGWYYNFEEDRYSFCESDSDKSPERDDVGGSKIAGAGAGSAGGAVEQLVNGEMAAAVRVIQRTIQSAREKSLSPQKAASSSSTTDTVLKIDEPILQQATQSKPFSPKQRPPLKSSASLPERSTLEEPKPKVEAPRIAESNQESGVRRKVSEDVSRKKSSSRDGSIDDDVGQSSKSQSMPPEKAAAVEARPRSRSIFDLIKPLSNDTLKKDLKVISVNAVKETIEKLNRRAEDVKRDGWKCVVCTLVNAAARPGCAACTAPRPAEYAPPTPSAAEDELRRLRRDQAALELPDFVDPEPRPGNANYLHLMELDGTGFVANTEPFECPVCLTEQAAGDGAVLRECLHTFCKGCLAQTIEFNEEAEVKCPYRDANYSCESVLQQREIKALVPQHIFEQHLARGVAQAENRMGNAFHCKTPDCGGWCILDDNVNEFRCPVCSHVNCLTCQAVHAPLDCRAYQDRLNSSSETNAEAKRTRSMLEDMVQKGDAMACPTCQVVLMKKWGCDWLRCSMCKTEICWVTRGPRWGPAGKGDTSAGCQCGVNGIKCHPKCNYCH